jgi:hypothetical protein
MKIKKAFYVGTNDFSYKPGEKGEIIGLKWVRPESDLPWRLCYIVLFADGAVDLSPVNDTENYELI